MARCEKRKNVFFEGDAPNMRRPDCCGLCVHRIHAFDRGTCGKHKCNVDPVNMVCDDFQYTTLVDTYQLNKHGNFEIKSI